MKRIAETLSIARSSLYHQPKPEAATSSERALRDQTLVAEIRRVVEDRPTYGYRRVTALLNRRRNAARVNHKRVFRVMHEQKLLLPKFTGRVQRAHTGTVMTLKSNIRWCSDGFEIRCWNGEKLHVAFAMDCCDREIIGWVASTQHLNSESIRDLIAMSIESRFQALEAPQPIEWLTDNGGMYTAHETRAFAAACKLKPKTTPSYSPESNGMAESFVKTFKRDYAYVQDLWTPESVLAMIPEWFDDYNKNHPHKALQMMSPQQFRCAQAS